MRPTLPLALVVLAALVLAACSSGDSGADGTEADAAPDELDVSTRDWETDFTKHSVPLGEFRGGGPPKDGIPAIDDPKHTSIEEAEEYLEDNEPVALLEAGGKARAYPIQVLTWHEIVNDELGGEPVAVTFCPLCNSTVAFSREVDGEVLDFGTTGNLRRSDLVMYDRQTESWWQQLTAEAVVGELTGTELEVLPSQILSWEEFKRRKPKADVLSRDTGFDRPYGENPYATYDSNVDSQPFLLDAEVSDALPPKERVAAVQVSDTDAVVYPFPRLAKDAPVNDEIDDEPVVVFYDPNVASALDSAAIAKGRDVGGAAVFERKVRGRTLDFEATDTDGVFTDRQTGSEWSMVGEAISGQLEGEQLKAVPSDDQFWFALAAFYEDPDIRG